MKCPNCSKEMNRDFCISCGYMLNGNIIKEKSEYKISDLEKYLGNDYDKIVRNNTILSTFILGPAYLSYKGFILVGTLLTILDIIINLFIKEVCTIITSYSALDVMIVIIPLIILVTRIFWVCIDNFIYIKLLNKKITKLKNTTNYDEYIKNKPIKNGSIVGIIISLGIIMIIFLVPIVVKYYIDLFKGIV